MKLDFWQFERPIRVDDGITHTSIIAGKDGIENIELLPSGMVVVDRTDARTIAILGSSFGLMSEEDTELRRKAREKKKGT